MLSSLSSLIAGLQCQFSADHHDRMFVTTVTPLLVVFSLFLCNRICGWLALKCPSWTDERRASLRRLADSSAAYALTLIFLVYVSASGSIFALLSLSACLRFDTSGGEIAFLEKDLSIDCNSPRHARFVSAYHTI